MEHDKQIPIWFFIGLLLALYGLLIFGSGVNGWIHPPEKQVALWNLHADIWWGILLIALGTLYAIKFRPSRK